MLVHTGKDNLKFPGVGSVAGYTISAKKADSKYCQIYVQSAIKMYRWFMKISRIDRYTPVARIEQNKTNNHPVNDYQFKETFDFREIDDFNNHSDILANAYETEYLLTVLARLIEEVVSGGCQIKISKALAINDYIVEAYFVSSFKNTQIPRIVLPLPLNELIIPVMDPVKIYPVNFLKNLINDQIIQPLSGQIKTGVDPNACGWFNTGQHGYQRSNGDGC